ncbi:MAG: O-antigen ligase family protein [Proteobacteria bacterium]|nr:O-antigen ligase family protein [Pseudomonadota bacterium]
MLPEKKTANYPTGFIFLILFCAFRPLTLIDLKIEIAGLNVLEVFAIITSYILLIFIVLNLRKIKFDFISLSILLFCSYCFISILWGSHVRSIAQVTLPFVLFFAIRVMVNEPKQIKLLLSVLLIAYCFPLFGSLYKIIQGFNVLDVDPITGIERFAGMFKRIHVFSQAMFFISIFFYIQVNINQLRNRQIKRTLLFLLIISFFCLLKTYVRSTSLGLFLFWAIALCGYNKKYFFILLISSLIIVVIYIGTIQQIFLKSQEMDLNVASSGRLTLWEHNISLFLESSFENKLLGHGAGVGSTGVFGSDNEIWVSHNDYLQLLMALGGVGLVAYLLIFFVLLKDVYMSSMDGSIKYFYYAVIFSITFINFTDGITLYQVGSSQQFWFVMGFLYVFKDFNATSSINLKNDNLTKSAYERTSGIYA